MVGVNALQRDLRDLVVGRLCATLAGRAREAEPSQAVDFELDEVTGDYDGSRNSRASVSLDDDRLVLAFETRASSMKMRAELVRDEEQGMVLNSPSPELSLGFFRTGEGDLGMMVGTTAYKRVAPSGSRRPAASG